MKINLHSFLVDSVKIIKEAPQLFIYNENKSIKNFGTGYIVHFNTGIQIWKKNKVFGNGLKSFKLKCSYQPYQTCNTHPHNYFIEIMVDTGLIGLGTIYLILILGIINFFKKYYNNYNIRNKFIGNIIFLLIVFELFPIRSTGSFFTTGNSFFIFLILPIFLNLNKLHFYNK